MINSRKTATSRTFIEQWVKKHTCYEGQISSCTQSFWRELATPLLKTIKELEEQTE